MNPSIQRKLELLAERHAEITLLLAQPDVLSDNARFSELSREYVQIEPVIDALHDYEKVRNALQGTRDMCNDAELREMADAEVNRLEQRLIELEKRLQILLLPTDPHDASNLFLEVRAGTGGNEAALFAGDLFRMYVRYAERQEWQLNILSESSGEYGGYKEIVARVEGRNVFSRLKFESGTHRVQRVPETEAQGRIHTSAATVAVLPEAGDVDVEIDDKDLKIDVYRSSGPGGQSVNTTDSAVRITHVPTGVVVQCQDQKSQLQNKVKAMEVLRARLLDRMIAEREAERSRERRMMVGTGDRSAKIRTYNFPQNRVTDHRVNLTMHNLGDVLDGDLDEIVSTLHTAYREETGDG